MFPDNKSSHDGLLHSKGPKKIPHEEKIDVIILILIALLLFWLLCSLGIIK